MNGIRLLLGVAALLVAAGCGSAGAEEAPELLPPGLAANLAKRSDAVAETLERGDACAAERQAKQLRTAVERAVANGRVPVRLRSELPRRASALVETIVCVTPPPAIESPVGEEDEDEDEDDEEDDD